MQKSFDYEKQKILEVEEAKSNRAIVNFEIYSFKKLDFESNPHEHESPQKHSSFNKSNAYQNFAPSVNSSVESNRSKAETFYDIVEFDTQNKIKGNSLFSVIHIDHL